MADMTESKRRIRRAKARALFLLLGISLMLLASPFLHLYNSEEGSGSMASAQTADSEPEAAAKVVTVDIPVGASSKTDDAYVPNPVSIKEGDTVTWVNKDNQPHTVTSGRSPGDPQRGAAFDSGLDDLLFEGDVFTHVFTDSGEFPYYCQLHPAMVGTVMVSEAAAADDDGGNGGTEENVTAPGSSDGKDDGQNDDGGLPASDQAPSEGNATTTATNHYQYLFGCTQYVPFYHCDPILNEFENFAVSATFSKVASVTREPAFVDTRYERGLQISSHALESLRADSIDAYKADEFTVFVSLRPDNSDPEFGNSYSNIAAYRNGVYRNDPHTSGWELSFYPSDDPNSKNLQFSVFNSDGGEVSTAQVPIPVAPDRFVDVAGSFDGGNVRLYVDGELKSSVRFEGTYIPDPGDDTFFKIAGDAYCSCYLTTAVIDEVRFYSRTLADEEVKGIAGSANSTAAADGGPSSGAGLAGYWKFDGDLSDSSASGNDLFYNTMIGSMAFAPDGRLFYTEKNSGNIRILLPEDWALVERPFASVPDVYVDWEQGLLGLAIDSKFDENRYVYAYYNYKDEASGRIYARLVRFTDSANVGTETTVLLDRIPASVGFHTGGALAFNSADDKLYVTVGDAINRFQAQNTSSLNGKVLRINRDGSIPQDNPFPGSPVFSYGHRNMYGIAFAPDGRGLVTEPGANVYDEINYVRKGANFGWPTMQPPDMAPETADPNNTSVKPLRSYFQTANPTQAIFYSGDRFPELKGKFLVGTFRGNLHSYELDASGEKLVEEVKIKTAVYPSLEVVGAAASPEGDVFFGAYDIYRLESIDYSGKAQVMFPVQVNSTNARVSSISFDQAAEKITVDLDDERGPSRVTVRVQNSMVGPIGFELSHESEMSLANDGKTEVRLPYKVASESFEDFSTVNLELYEDYSQADSLQFVISGADLSVTKTIPEFPPSSVMLAALFLAAVIALFTIRSRFAGTPSGSQNGRNPL